MTDAPTVTGPGHTPEADPYWQGLQEGRIRLPWCARCEAFVWTPRTRCSTCLDPVPEWRDASTTGVVHSVTLIHRGQGIWADEAPYALAYVDLTEGPTIIANLTVGADAPQIGDVVRLLGAGPAGGALFGPVD